MLRMFKVNKACKFPKKNKKQFKNKRQQKDPTN